MNELFALKTVEAIRRLEEERLAKGEDVVGNPPIVWVHDYHLMLAANTIRYYYPGRLQTVKYCKQLIILRFFYFSSPTNTNTYNDLNTKKMKW